MKTPSLSVETLLLFGESLFGSIVVTVCKTVIRRLCAMRGSF